MSHSSHTAAPHSSSKGHHFPWRYFLTALAVFCLGHWLGTQALHGVQQQMPLFGRMPGLLALVAFVALAACFQGMHLAHEKWPRPGRRWQRVLQFTLAVVILVSAFFVAASVEHVLGHWLHLEHHPVIFALVCLVALAFMEPVFRRLQAGLQRPRDIRPLLRLRREAIQPVEALVLFVSTPNHPVQFPPADTGRHAVLQFRASGGRLLRGAGHLEEDIAEISRELKEREYWNWQQLLRALRGHPALRRVILMGSTGERGSHKDLPVCGRFLQPYLPAGCTVDFHSQPLDFTDFNGLVDALRGILDTDLGTLPKNRVAIDVTGGTATASIAGAATTMDQECVFQYVNTNAPHDILAYDVVHEHGQHLH